MSTNFTPPDLKNIVPEYCCSFIVNSEHLTVKNSIVNSIVQNYKNKFPHLKIISTIKCNDFFSQEELFEIIEINQLKNFLKIHLERTREYPNDTHSVIIIDKVEKNNEIWELILSELIHNSRAYCLAVIIMDENFVENYPKLAPYAYKLIFK